MPNIKPRPSPTMIRGLDPAIWERIKAEARRHDLGTGALLNLIAAEWLAGHACDAYGGPLASTEASAANEESAPR